MKRAFPANIDGQVFYIDEDAYELLNTYLQQLANTFRGDDGREIVADIESRIRELFAERLDKGPAVIVLADVQNVISTMGRPEDITEETDGYKEASEVPPVPCDKGTEADTASDQSAPQPPISKTPFSWASLGIKSRHRLFRNMQDKVFGGVFGGLAAYLGWNANIMRILCVLLAIFPKFTFFWPLIIIYLIAWMVIPPALTPRQVLEMKGEPVNVDSIGKTLITPPVYKEDSGHIITNALRVAGKVVMAFVGFFAGLGLFGCVVAFLVVGAAYISFEGFGSVALLNGLDLFDPPYNHLGMSLQVLAVLVGFLLAIIILTALVWTACCVVFKSKGASRNTLIIWGIVLAVLVAVFSGLMFAINGYM